MQIAACILSGLFLAKARPPISTNQCKCSQAANENTGEAPEARPRGWIGVVSEYTWSSPACDAVINWPLTQLRLILTGHKEGSALNKQDARNVQTKEILTNGRIH